MLSTFAQESSENSTEDSLPQSNSATSCERRVLLRYDHTMNKGKDDPVHHSALAVLHIAADAIRQYDGIVESTAENDHKSGEIIFTTITGETYCLKLTRVEDEESAAVDFRLDEPS